MWWPRGRESVEEDKGEGHERRAGVSCVLRVSRNSQMDADDPGYAFGRAPLAVVLLPQFAELVCIGRRRRVRVYGTATRRSVVGQGLALEGQRSHMRRAREVDDVKDEAGVSLANG